MQAVEDSRKEFLLKEFQQQTYLVEEISIEAEDSREDASLKLPESIPDRKSWNKPCKQLTGMTEPTEEFE